MKVLLLLALLHVVPAPGAADRSPGRYYALQGVGAGVHYGQGRMERVAVVRARQGYAIRADVPGVSLPDCGLLGRLVWVRARQDRTQPWSPWRVTQAQDCSDPADWGWHTRHGGRAWVELAYPLARAWRVSGTFQVDVRWR